MSKSLSGAILGIPSLLGALSCGGLALSNSGAGNDGGILDSASSKMDSGRDDGGSADATSADSSPIDASSADTGRGDGGSCRSADSGPPPPSCAAGGPGMTNCGACSESCCTSLEVTGGTYYRTYSNDGSGPVGEADPATVSGFRLDKYEVTVGRFRQFVNAWKAGWLPAPGSGKHTYLNGGLGLVNSADGGTYETGWNSSDDSNVVLTAANLTACDPTGDPVYATWTPSAGTQENLPINCVGWYDAYAFCIWDGGFLPSEAEWEYAAAGGSEQREYVWGTNAPGADNRYAIYGCDNPGGTGTCTGLSNIAQVGTATMGAGRWGQLDLAGNVIEWSLDQFAGYVDPCTDCADLTPSSLPQSVGRGGGFDEPESYLLPPTRGIGSAMGETTVGLRCSRAP